MINYTFYGDLLGVGNYYRLGSKIAEEKLDRFYNLTNENLAEMRQIDYSCRIDLFSDSLFITGDDVFDAIKRLSNLYSSLLSESLLLRGAIVKGRLNFQNRITIDEHFRKNLPTDDTLARAAGLEKSYKGARLIIETALAKEIFVDCPKWRTHEDYVKNKNLSPPHAEILRLISPTPDNRNFELLYPLPLDNFRQELTGIKKTLTYVMKMSDDDLKKHYSETLDLINRSELKYKLVKENS
jgi:hypothetical protein